MELPSFTVPGVSEPTKALGKAPLKPSQTGSDGLLGHPSGAGSSASTASGPSVCSSSSFIGTASHLISQASPLVTGDSYTPGSRSSAGTTSKRHYVALVPGGTPISSNSSGFPPNAVAMTDMSPAWCQYQTSGTSWPCTPLYCSLTPTRTSLQPGNALAGPGGNQIHQEEVERVPLDKDKVDACASKLYSAVSKESSRKGSEAEPSRRSSLLLHETPLEVQSLPEEVQAVIQQGGAALQQDVPAHVPEWFDPEAGCIRRECFPELPSYRTTLDSSAARLSIASRTYQRVRWPGEPARVTGCGDHPGSGPPVRRLSCPDATAIYARPDSSSELRKSPGDRRAGAGCPEHTAHPAPSDVSEGLAARSRRVRFATVATAREYKEMSSSPESAIYSVSGRPLRPPTPVTTKKREEGAEPSHTPVGHTATQGCRGDVLRRMIELIERLLNCASLHLQEHTRENLNLSVQLLRAFESECVDHAPGLSFLADTLEACQELMEHKLPEQELDPLMKLIEATRVPLLSREALVKLHRLRQELRQPQDLHQLLTPLDTLQHLRVDDRRKATTRLSLYASTADKPLLDTNHHTSSNVFLLEDSACGIVSTRHWGESTNPRAFAVDILKRCEQGVLSSKTTKIQGGENPSAGNNAETVQSGTLSSLVEKALQQTAKFGTCSLCLLSLDDAGEKLRFATCGFVRAIVLRRSPASGVLCRLAEAPVRDAASAAEMQLFKWPSKQELVDELLREHQLGKSEGVDKAKDHMDPGTRKQALLRVVERAESGGWSCRGIVEQEVAVQEGDFFVIADELLFEVVSSEELRHLFSCCVTCEEDSASGHTPTTPSVLSALLKRLWKQRVQNVHSLVSRLKEKRQRVVSQAAGMRPVADTTETCPLDLSFVVGWIRNGSTEEKCVNKAHCRLLT